MKNINLYNVYLYYTIFMFGVVIFFIGFFTISHNVDAFNNTQPPIQIDEISLNYRYRSHASKFILMIVDAFRYNFISNKNMPFLSKKLMEDNGNCLIRMKVKVPTVTLPRIKTLVTGTISNFIDVILNFGHIALTQDSFVHQMAQRNDKIVYYGDTTWTSLFPDKFIRFETNTDALFLNDFDEGDKNVRKNIEQEMLKEWDHLIFHFLGLDHIGHVEGSFSPRINLKLKEMDDVIQLVDRWITVFDKNFSLPTLFFVTADHGMRLSGGHGGSTTEETSIPLVILNGKCKNTNIIYNQIDTAPTLSILLGLPIPANSIGTIISEAIDTLSLEDQLYAFYYNAKHLVKKVKQKIGRQQVYSKEYYNLYKLGKEAHKQFLNLETVNKTSIYLESKEYYQNCSKIISGTLEASLARFDFYLITLGLALSVTASIKLILIGFVSIEGSIQKHKSSTICKDCIISLVIGASTFLFFKNINLLALIDNPLSILQILFSALFYYVVLSFLRMFKNTHSPKLTQNCPLNIFLVASFHILSYLSSSYIEEEHQTWYYIVSSYLIILFVMDSFCKKTRNDKYVLKSNLAKCLISQQYKRFYDNLKVYFSTIKFWIVVFLFHILARRLNQTGDKWLHLQDFGDWLNFTDNKNLLSYLCILGFLLIIVTTNINPKNVFLNNIFKIIALAAIYFYRAANGDVSSFIITNDIFKQQSLYLFSICCWILAILSYVPTTYNRLFQKSRLNEDIKNMLGTNCILIILLSALVHRPHNVILLPTCVLTLRLTYKSLDKLVNDENITIIKAITTLWIGKMFYFYQGNSNNLATVDVTPGFIGTDQSNLIFISFLLTINTFSFPICCLTMLFYNLYNELDLVRTKNAFKTSITLCTIFVAIPVTFYLFILVGHRHHLFIYSVFAPKFLFELIYICLWNILLLCSSLFTKCFL